MLWSLYVGHNKSEEWHIFLPLLRYLRCVAMELEEIIFVLDCI